MDNGQATVTLDGREYPYRIPTDFAIQRELVVSVQTNTMRGSAALLGLMVPALGFSHLYAATGYNAMAFGGRVWEGLVREGVDETQIPIAGLELFTVLKPIAYPSEQEIVSEMGNSSRPTDESGGSPSQ